MQKKVDALGFDKFEIANARRAAAANKSNYNKIDKIKAKIVALGKELDAAEALAETWDAPAKQMSNSKLGVALTARQIVYYHDNPQEFYRDYPEAAANEPENVPFTQASTDGTEPIVEDPEGEW